MKKYLIINNVEGTVLVNTRNKHEFIAYVRLIFKENEEDDSLLKLPKTIGQAKDYLTLHCSNLEWFTKF